MPLTNQAPALTRPDGTPLQVLVVDDEVNIAELVSMAVRYEGWVPTVANTGSKAVNAAKQQRPDAVVLDVMLPRMNGFDVCRDLRQRGAPGATADDRNLVHAHALTPAPLTLSAASSSGQRARAGASSPSTSPAAKRSAPAQPIIAALSVHSHAGGTEKLRP